MGKKKNATEESEPTTNDLVDASLTPEGGEHAIGIAVAEDAPIEPAPEPAAKPKKGKKPKADATLRDACEGYMKHLENSGAGAGSIASYTMELKLALRELGAETRVADLTVERVRAYFGSDVVMRTRAGRPKAKPTYLKTQRVLRLALCWAEDKKLIERAPIPDMTKA